MRTISYIIKFNINIKTPKRSIAYAMLRFGVSGDGEM